VAADTTLQASDAAEKLAREEADIDLQVQIQKLVDEIQLLRESIPQSNKPNVGKGNGR